MLASSHRDLVASLAPTVRAAAREAGSLALASFRHGASTVAELWYKNRGASPVTAADMAVDAFLRDTLSRMLPEAGWLSEETADGPDRLESRLIWIVDPIDGTRAFASGHADWCIAIGLLDQGRPILGIVFAPAHDVLYEASSAAAPPGTATEPRVSVQDRLDGARVAGPKPLVDLSSGAPGRIERIAQDPLPRPAPGAGRRRQPRCRPRLGQFVRLGHRRQPT